MSVQDLQEKLLNFSYTYFLTDLRKDKDQFYALSAEDLKENFICCGGYILNLILDGELDKANKIISLLPDDHPAKPALTIVNPCIDWKEFIRQLEICKKKKQPLKMIVLTAGRPYLLNGFNDFTRLGPMLERYKDACIDGIQYLYGTECAPFIFNLSLAEYYYQQNRLVEAEMLVSRTIKEFDKKNEVRFLFTALYLQSRILLANGSLTRSASYIRDIKNALRILEKQNSPLT